MADCADARLTGIPTALLSNTDWLLLSGNNISELTGQAVSNMSSTNLAHLSKLDLHASGVISIDDDFLDVFVQSENLKFLDLSHNELTSLPETIRNVSSLETLNISGNPFVCSCDVIWMRDWLANHSALVPGFHDVKCRVVNGPWIQVIQMNETEMGCLPVQKGSGLSLAAILGEHAYIRHTHTFKNAHARAHI